MRAEAGPTPPRVRRAPAARRRPARRRQCCGTHADFAAARTRSVRYTHLERAAWLLAVLRLLAVIPSVTRHLTPLVTATPSTMRGRRRGAPAASARPCDAAARRRERLWQRLRCAGAGGGTAHGRGPRRHWRRW